MARSDPRLDPEAVPIVLRQDAKAKLKAALTGSLCGFFAVVGLVLAVGAGADDGVVARLAGVAIALLALPLTVYWLLQLLPGACRLTVAHDGLHVRHSFVSRRRRWEQVDRFYTRTYKGHKMSDWTGVAFARRDGKGAGAGSFVEGVLRARGVFDTDLLPDTYGVPPHELRSFLDACDVRWSGEKLGSAPSELPATRGFFALSVALLLAFIAGFGVFAAGAATEGDWVNAGFGLLLASPFVYALTRAVKRRRRFTISSTQR